MNQNNNHNNHQHQRNLLLQSIITIDEHHLCNFSSNVKSLHATNIAVLETVPDPLTFLREYVALSKPVIIRNAFPKMSLDEIIQGNEHLMLHVDVTPDGHGDCIRTVDGQRVFVMPLVREMSLGQLTCGLRRQQQQPNQHTIQEKSLEDENGLMVFYTTTKERVQEDTTSSDDDKNQENDNNHHKNNHHNQSEILYYSRQNDCLRTEVQPLMKFFPSTISFAEEAFNTKPEAVNIWIGNEKSVSSIHKDHYENIMCVTCGEKEFTICPPLDAMFLKESSFPTGTFCRRNSPNGQGPWTVEMNGHDDDDNVTTSTMTTRWIESFNAKILLSSSSSSS